MAEILSQAEIEALLSSMTDDSDGAPSAASASSAGTALEPVRRPTAAAPVAAAKTPARNTMAYEIYDFRRPDKFAKDQLRTLQMLHDTFARLFASSMSAYLRVPVPVDMISIEQVPYDEYMRSLNNSIINVFSLSPLVGQAILEMEFTVLLSMIDRLLGGPGSMVKSSNILTDIERALTESIINRALQDFHTAWEGIAQFTPKRESMETQSQFVQIVPPNDVVVSILFEIKVGDTRGAMSLCIPFLLLKPITTKLSAQRWFASSVKKNTGKHANVLARRLEKTQLTCAVRLGSTSISVEDLLQLQVGDVITLDRKKDEEVEVLIDDHLKFRARPGTRGKKLAVHISRVSVDAEPVHSKR